MVRIFGIGKARVKRAEDEKRRIDQLQRRVDEIKDLRDDAILAGQHERVALLEKELDIANERLVMTLDLRGFDTL